MSAHKRIYLLRAREYSYLFYVVWERPVLWTWKRLLQKTEVIWYG